MTPRSCGSEEGDRGVELEIIAVVLPDKLLIIHVMPTSYRR